MVDIGRTAGKTPSVPPSSGAPSGPPKTSAPAEARGTISGLGEVAVPPRKAEPPPALPSEHLFKATGGQRTRTGAGAFELPTARSAASSRPPLPSSEPPGGARPLPPGPGIAPGSTPPRPDGVASRSSLSVSSSSGAAPASSVPGAKAESSTAAANRHLETVGKDPRLQMLFDANNPSFVQRMKKKATTAETYGKMVPLVGVYKNAMKAWKGNVDHKAANELGRLARSSDAPKPLLSALSAALSKGTAKDRDEASIAVVFSAASSAVSFVVPGVGEAAGQVVAHGAAATVHGLAGATSSAVQATAAKSLATAVEKGARLGASMGAGAAAAKAEDARRTTASEGINQRVDTGKADPRNLLERGVDAVEGRVEGYRQGDMSGEEGVGEGAGSLRYARMPDTKHRDIGDPRSARALIAYLGPSDQSEDIRGLSRITEDERTELLAYEASRMELRRMLGAEDGEDVSRRTVLTKDELENIKMLSKRTEGEHVALQDRSSDRNHLKDLWHLTGLIEKPGLWERFKAVFTKTRTGYSEVGEA